MCANRLLGQMWEGRRCGLASVLVYLMVVHGAAPADSADGSGAPRPVRRGPGAPAGGPTFTVRPDHPRLYVTPERLPMLRHQFGITGYEGVGSHFGRLSEGYLWLRQITVNQINGGRRDLGALRSYMFFALMEDGNPFFLEAAKQSANTEISRWIIGQNPAHEGSFLGRSPEIAIYFDWLYNYLSPAARDSIAPYIVDGTATFIDDPARAAVIPWSCTSNYNVYPFSIYGEGYADSLAHAGANEAYYWFTEGYLPATDEIYGGGLVHGYAGVRMSAMIHTAELLLTATGQDFWAQSPFLQNAGMGILSRVRNDGVTADGVGKYNVGEADPEVTMPILAARYRNGSMQTLASLVADDMSTWFGSASPNAINLLLFYDATVPEAPLGELPLAWSGQRGGIVYMRDVWRLYGQNAENDIHAGFFNGPHIVTGELGAQNHFIIARGQDPLIIHGSDFKENDIFHWFSNWFDKTISHNGLLVVDPTEDYGEQRDIPLDNDGGASRPGDEAMGITHYPECNRIGAAEMRYRGRTTRFEDTPDHCYARGEDAELAYKVGKLSEWTRDFVYVRPGLFFVFDRVQAADSTLAKSVVFHMVNQPTLDGTETQLEGSAFGGVYESTNSAIFRADRGTSRIFGQTVFPANRKIRRIGGGNASGLGMRQSHKTFAGVTYDPDHSYEYYLGGKNNAPGPDFAGDPTLYTLADRDNRNASNANPAGDWRIEVASRDAKFRDYFLQVLWATSTTETAMVPVIPVVSQEANASGALVSDSLFVAFARTDGVTSVTFEGLALDAELDVIFAGLTPGATFDASFVGELLSITPGSAYTTSDAGVLQFSMETPAAPFRMKSELFQNPVLTQYADVATLANYAFEEPPTVRISAGTDTTAVSMDPFTGVLDAYRGRYEFQTSGPHTIETRGRGGEGSDTTTIRTFIAEEILPGPSRRIHSVDGAVTLAIGAGVVTSRTYFLADVTEAGPVAGAGKIYRFGPVRDFSEPLVLEMRYDTEDVEHPDKLTIQKQEGDAWVSLPTQVSALTGLARTSVSRLGNFRLVEDPLAVDSYLVPDHNRLRMVRPNPFVSTASIEVDVAQDGPLQLTVHNVQGQRVKTLFNNPRVAGRYSFIWDGRGDTGRRVAGGVYFCRLQVASHVETRRLLVLPE